MSIVVALREKPFIGKPRIEFIDPEGPMPSIAEIVVRQKDLPACFAEHCVARVNGEVIPREKWGKVRPRVVPGRDISVTFTLPMGGGGQGGGGQHKNPVAVVAMIAVVLVAAAVSGGALGPAGLGWLGASFAAGTIGASVAGAAIGIGGAVAIAALTPPPTLSGNQGISGSASSGIAGANSQPASLSANVLAKGAPIPRVIGTHRLFPPLLCQPLVDIDGDKEVAEAVYGLSGPHLISDMMVGNAPVETISEIDTEIQEGLPNSPVLGLVMRQGFTDTTAAVQMSEHQVVQSDGIALASQGDPSSSTPQWEGMASRTSPDEVWITISFPSGLVFLTSPSIDVAVPFRVRIRQHGTSSWINLPEFQYVRHTSNQIQFMIKLKWQTAPSSRNVPPSSGGVARAYSSVPTQSTTPIGIGGWTADSYFYDGAGDTYLTSANVSSTTGIINMDCFTDRVEYYLNDNTKFPQNGIWDIQVIRGLAIRNDVFTIATYAISTIVYDLFGYGLVTAVYKTPNSTDKRTYSAAAVITRIASVWNSSPVPDPTKFALIGVRVTGRSMDQFSVLASGYIKDWGGSAWDTLTTTSNPAPHLYDVLTGTLGGSPIPVDIIDSAAIVAWRAACVTLGYTVNAVVEGKTYLDVANMICGAGYARLTHNEKWGIFRDKNRSLDTPVQIFSPRNMNNFSWTRAFTKAATGIRATYNDSTNNYAQTEAIVYDDSAVPDNDLLEQIQYDGLVTAAAAQARAAFDLLQSKKRFTFYKGDADLEAIVCQRGDLVGVQHDTLSSRSGAARIKSVTTSGGNVTAVTLDGTIPVETLAGIFSTSSLYSADHIFDLGAKTGIAIRLKGGNGIITKEVTAAANDDETALTFVTPFTDPGTSQLDAGCVVTAGALGTEYKRLIVYGIAPKTDMTATLTFVDEAPELWA